MVAWLGGASRVCNISLFQHRADIVQFTLNDFMYETVEIYRPYIYLSKQLYL